MTLSDIKRAIRVGDVYDVTNHYVTNPEHVWFGTTRRRVQRVNSVGFALELEPHRDDAEPPSILAWPKASQIERDPDGTIRIYGRGPSFGNPNDLFLTLVPVNARKRYSITMTEVATYHHVFDEDELAQLLGVTATQLPGLLDRSGDNPNWSDDYGIVLEDHDSDSTLLDFMLNRFDSAEQRHWDVNETSD